MDKYKCFHYLNHVCDTVPIDVAIQCLNYIFYAIYVSLQITTVALLYLVNVGEI